MTTYRVLVDVDARGGDDDVHTFAVKVEAANEEAARAAAEEQCAQRFGRNNVLGAYQADALPLPRYD